MKKLFVMLIMLLVLMNAAIAVDNLLSDGFGEGTDRTTTVPGWVKSAITTSGRDDEFSITSPSDGNYYAWIKRNGFGNQYISRAINATGYQNMTLSYDYYLYGNLSENSFLMAEIRSNGGKWRMVHKVSGLEGWNHVKFSLPVSNSVFTLRFKEIKLKKNQQVFVDNVNVTGTPFLASVCGNSIVEEGEQCDSLNLSGQSCVSLGFDFGNLTCGNNCVFNTSNCSSSVCGNGVVEAGEQCDDGNVVSGDGCSAFCFTEAVTSICGNGLVEAGEQCDDGNVVSGDGCSAACQLEAGAVCGNGLVEASEQCDSLNLSGQSCVSLGFDFGNLTCGNNCVFNTSNCSSSVCGNGVVEPGEQCDDGNLANGDGCSASCVLEPAAVCGNGVVEAGEQCDGSNLSNQSCVSLGFDFGNLSCDCDCTFELGNCSDYICGNGIVEPGEQCDDGNVVSGDGCAANCTIEVPAVVCGNGIIEMGEQCDGLNLSNQNCTSLGFGFGNLTCGNNCLFNLSNCSVGPVCGNGIVEPGEQCDLFNLTNETCDSLCFDYGNLSCYSNCTFNKSECRVAVCGNGIVEPGEQCDDGNVVSGDGCAANCKLEGPSSICGNGLVEAGEQCDDGNVVSGDGCSAFCFTEAVTSICGNGILDPGEECDDNNTVSGDGCAANCTFEVVEPCPTHVDLMLLIDRSDSMNITEGSSTRIENAKQAAMAFVDILNESLDQAGLVSFATQATLDQPLAFNHQEVKDAIAALQIQTPPPQRTNVGEGIMFAHEEMTAHAHNQSRVIVLLSDGAPNERNDPNMSCDSLPTAPTPCTDYAIEHANMAKNESSEIFVIGIGVTNFTEQVLKQIATDEGHYFSAVNSTVLNEIYQQIVQGLCPCEGFNCSINTGQCSLGFCNLTTNTCDVKPMQISTPCETDSDLCTLEHCNGNGSCVPLSSVNCSGLNTQCQSGACNPSTGQCYANFSGFPFCTSCEADGNLCTLDHCDGAGNCVTFDTIGVPAAQQCKAFYCDPSTGQIKENYTGFPLSTPCETDNDPCTVEHCNGNGSCVINAEAVPPTECLYEADSKVAQAMPDFNFGLGKYMIVNPKQGAVDRSYIRLNVSALAANLSHAELMVAVYSTGSDVVGRGINAYYCHNHSFVETGITWNNQPFNSECRIADTYIMSNTVVAGIPETWHAFDLIDEIQNETSEGDGAFTVVLIPDDEGNVTDNSRYVQYLTKEYNETAFRPKLNLT